MDDTKTHTATIRNRTVKVSKLTR